MALFQTHKAPPFNELLKEQLLKSREAVERLKEILAAPTSLLKGCQIDEIEEAADQLRDNMVKYLETVFILPVDRHDLYTISRLIDDITDEVQDIKDFVLFFQPAESDKISRMLDYSLASIDILTDSLDRWEETGAENYRQLLRQAKRNTSNEKRLYWERLQELQEGGAAATMLTDMDFTRSLYRLAKKINKLCDHLSELKIKSLK